MLTDNFNECITPHLADFPLRLAGSVVSNQKRVGQPTIDNGDHLIPMTFEFLFERPAANPLILCD
jgi:hypothetical protein